MSCSSMFTFIALAETSVLTTYTCNVAGSIGVPGYTTPGWTTTTTMPAVAHWNQKNICVGGVTTHNGQITTSTCTSWTVASSTYQICATITGTGPVPGWTSCAETTAISTETFTHPNNVHKYSGIPIWPSTGISANANITFEIESTNMIILPPPPGSIMPITPAYSIVITINTLNISVGTSFETINISIPITEPVTVTVSNGQFSAKVPIPNANYTDSYVVGSLPDVGEITYEFSITPYILFCATPVAPMTFVNLLVDIEQSISCKNPITGEPITFFQALLIECPVLPE